jgi:SNF2 family DNA or RNA helicase
MELTKLEEKNYQSASEELINVIKSTKNKLEKSNGLAKLKQLAYLAKRNSLFVWIDEFMEDNDKLILGCWHKMVIDDLMERYGKIALKIDGSVTDKNRQIAEDRFQTDPKVKIIILQIDAGGEGLTLTASNSVGIIECPDTPGQIIQFCDRAHRKGQTKQVTIYFPFANGTIENIVADRIEESFRSMSMILDGKESKGIFNYSFDEILMKNLER